MRAIITIAAVCIATIAFAADKPYLDMKEMLDESTLDIKVVTDWHVVNGNPKTRQKVVDIFVGTIYEGMDLRVPVRFVVPADRKAKGFHLTGNLNQRALNRDIRAGGVSGELLKGGVGLVQTTVSAGWPSKTKGKEIQEKFLKTLNPRHTMRYWGWPASLMRAITAAHAEKEHFEPGKIAMSGRSKNGATPTAVLVVDKRTTAVHAAASPIGGSPLRMCDQAAWKELDEYYQKNPMRGQGSAIRKHFAVGGIYGLNKSKQILAAGHDWEKLQALALQVADNVFISRNLEQLKDRKVDMLFYPGTHDYICYDLPWCGPNCPQIPIYLKANVSHARRGDPNIDADTDNKSAFLLNHFFDDVDPLLEPPAITHKIDGGKLSVTVQFKPASGEETGHVYWMFDRPPYGTLQYLSEQFPSENRKEMVRQGDEWTVLIGLKAGAKHVDLFTTHRKTVKHKSTAYPTYLSSPYTRLKLQ